MLHVHLYMLCSSLHHFMYSETTLYDKEVFRKTYKFETTETSNRLGRKCSGNKPCSIYQYSNMAPRFSGQTSIFSVVFFVSIPSLF